MTEPYYSDESVTLWHGDCLDVLRNLPDASVDCCVTSPPYFGLRSYLPADHPDKAREQGAEPSPAEYVAALVDVFREVRRVLADDGTLWLNIGDSYYSGRGASTGADEKNPARRFGARTVDKGGVDWAKPKNLLGIPWRVAFALQDDGWILRNDIIWAKPNGMPEAVQDRLSTKHEHVFLLSKSRRYHFDLDAIREPAVTTSPSALSWARDTKEADVPGQSMRQHRADRADERPQKRRAAELFETAGLTDAHLAAMRAVGMSDAGKALVTQDGTGKNAAETQRLADEAKAALGGYYREFLYDGGRNPGDVWMIATQPFTGAHFAVMALALADRCVRAGCKPGGTVLDPYSGSGTTGLAAARHGARYVGIDLDERALQISLETRLAERTLPLTHDDEAVGA